MIAQRMLVVLPNWFGETLFTTPFLRSLRQGRPQAFIAALGWPQCRQVLLHSPLIDAFIEFDERGAHRSVAGKWRLIRTLRNLRCDTAIILRKSLSRTILLAAAGIPTRIGWTNPKSGWLLTHRVTPLPGPQHKAKSYLPLLSPMGVAPLDGPYEYTVSAHERDTARQRLANATRPPAEPLVILHPGANWAHKRWPPERFAALGDQLVASHHVRIVITGGPQDAALASQVQQGMRQPTVLLAGQTSWRELGACLEQADLVISNDTGILHMAAALRRPVVALYGPTSPTLTGPLGDPARTTVIHHPDCCPSIPCFSPDRPPHAGMASISVDEAYAAAERLLAQHASLGAGDGNV